MLSPIHAWHTDQNLNAFSLVERVWAHPPPPAPVTSAHPSYRPQPGLKNELYKTEMCRSWVATGGFCKYAEKCQFSHGSGDLRPVKRHPRYKTKLCRNWTMTGSCNYGTRCRFQHLGEDTLPSPSPPASSVPVRVRPLPSTNVYAFPPAYFSAPDRSPPQTYDAYDAPLASFPRDLLAELPAIANVHVVAPPPDYVAASSGLAPLDCGAQTTAP